MSEPIARSTSARRVGEIAQAGDATVGIAVSAAVAASVRGGGLEAAAAARGSAAVAVTELEQRGERWWGRIARGVTDEAATTRRVAFDQSSGGVTAAPGIYGEVRLENPWPVPCAVVVTGTVDDWLVINGVPESPQNPRSFRIERSLAVGETLTLSAVNRSPVPFNPWHLRGEAAFTRSVAVLDWKPAARALVPVLSGFPWWGFIAGAARGGQWVRRASWAAGRRLRYEAGLGTERAVARQELGGVVTTVDAAAFGAAEFVAEDWLIEGEESALVDVTDVVFAGPEGAVIFVVTAAASEPPGDGGDGGGGGVTFPPTGEGVPYVRGGQVVRLLPIKDGAGAVWQP